MKKDGCEKNFSIAFCKNLDVKNFEDIQWISFLILKVSLRNKNLLVFSRNGKINGNKNSKFAGIAQVNQPKGSISS